jgi:hypothetical protein
VGRAYQELFAGEDTDEAEAAGQHFGQAIELITQYLTKKPE